MSKYKSFKGIEFKESINQDLYMRIRRASDPIKEIKLIEQSIGREIVDRKKAKEKYSTFKRLLLITFGTFIYYGYITLLWL